MKKIFYTFATLLFVTSACKKDSVSEFANKLVVGTWNEVGLSTKIPTGKYLKLTDGGGMESTAIPGYNSYEVKSNQLTFKGTAGTSSNQFLVSSDSLYIEPNAPCANVNGCATLYAKQK